MNVADLLAHLVKRVGPERFENACALAWQTAEHTGKSTWQPWPEDLAQVPHELTEVLFDDPTDPLDASDLARQGAIWAAYARMPSYALLMMLPAVREPEVLADYWEHLRALLDDPDPCLATPAAYHLWSGAFENDSLAAVTDAWQQATKDAARSPRRLARILEIAGPVPWSLKRELYLRVGDNPLWQGRVRASIEAARLELYGHVDEKEAARWAPRPRP